MGHDILDDEKCVVVGEEPAWHKLGQHFTDPKTAEEAHDAMGGSFELEQKPMGYYDEEDDVFYPVDGKFVILRGHTNKDNNKIPFGFSTEHYKLIQPIDIIKKFDEKVGLSISSMGFIQQGRKMFLSWDLPYFEIANDFVKMYGNVLFGFDTVFSSRLNIGTFKVVCANTFQAAVFEGEGKESKRKGFGTVYSGKHTNKKLLYELGEWMEFIQQNSERQVNLTKSFFKKLVDTPVVHEKQAKDLLEVAWPNPAPVPDFFPDSLRGKEQDKIDEQAEKMETIKGTIFDIYSSNRYMGDDGENYWRLFNSATQFFNHEQKSKKDTAYSIVWGNRNNEMNRFAEVLRSDMENK